MDRKIKALIFGKPDDCTVVRDALQSSALHHELCYVEDIEELETKLVDWEPSLAIVLADGAIGMESVFRLRQRRPCIPVFWFSDDREFCMQSYRLDCAYFSTKPVTCEKISNAIARCDHVGIPYTAN